MKRPSTISSAALVRYSWARWIGLRVWKPTMVVQPRAANSARVSAGVLTYGATAWMCEGSACAEIRPASVRELSA